MMARSTTGTGKTYIWGAADAGKDALEYCKAGFNIAGFIDKRAGQELYEFCSMPVISPTLFFKGNIEKISNILIAVRYPAEVIDWIRCDRNCGNIRLYIFDGRNKNDPLLYQVRNGEICVPEYMDKRFRELKEYADHYSKLNPFIRKMFQTALSWTEEYGKESEICELGCGSGQFANILFDYGYEQYTGIDFSSQAIELARRANPLYADKFVCEDVFSYLAGKRKTRDTLFVSFEVMEHIRRDIELCNMLPDGSVFIFSVPSFRSFNHIRMFQDLESIQNRYQMLDIVKYSACPANMNADKSYHLLVTIKQEKGKK